MIPLTIAPVKLIIKIYARLFCRGNFREQHSYLDVKWRSLDAVRRIQRYERHWTEIPLVRVSFGQWKHKLVSGNQVAEVRDPFTDPLTGHLSFYNLLFKWLIYSFRNYSVECLLKHSTRRHLFRSCNKFQEMKENSLRSEMEKHVNQKLKRNFLKILSPENVEFLESPWKKLNFHPRNFIIKQLIY